MSEKPKIGTIFHTELTVDNATEIRDFYAAVIGWEYDTIPVEDHEDYVMKTRDGDWVTGICHRLAPNANIPPQWLAWVAVEDLEHSLEICEAQGGKVIAPVRQVDEHSSFAIIQDPAGAVLALSGPTPASAES
jgi:predicted enzyme related to lactoylglutathione lyase